VEALEHRVVTGAGPGTHVHHINGDRADNRLCNLEVLTPAEHGLRHSPTKAHEDEMARLYLSGRSTYEIGRMLGFSAGGVYRRLLAMGVQMRTIKESRRVHANPALVVSLAEQGYRAKRIAKMLGMGQRLVSDIFKEHGIPPFPTGRPPKR